MTYGKSRNVVVVKNIDSNYIEQAILIIKKNVGGKEYFGSEEDIVCQAQKIIDSFIKSQNARKKNNFKGYIKYIVYAGILAAALLLFYIFKLI